MLAWHTRHVIFMGRARKPGRLFVVSILSSGERRRDHVRSRRAMACGKHFQATAHPWTIFPADASGSGAPCFRADVLVNATRMGAIHDRAQCHERCYVPLAVTMIHPIPLQIKYGAGAGGCIRTLPRHGEWCFVVRRGNHSGQEREAQARVSRPEGLPTPPCIHENACRKTCRHLPARACEVRACSNG